MSPPDEPQLPVARAVEVVDTRWRGLYLVVAGLLALEVLAFWLLTSWAS